ncbi:hypothetical protein AAHA92_22016 [Salvia divinorum]|uniref:Secreted protein n=1 Tax=Salvia divinorum TaxID=28513 RepID=A0ABD1GMA5_SALDI
MIVVVRDPTIVATLVSGLASVASSTAASPRYRAIAVTPSSSLSCTGRSITSISAFPWCPLIGEPESPSSLDHLRHRRPALQRETPLLALDPPDRTVLLSSVPRLVIAACGGVTTASVWCRSRGFYPTLESWSVLPCSFCHVKSRCVICGMMTASSPPHVHSASSLVEFVADVGCCTSHIQQDMILIHWVKNRSSRFLATCLYSKFVKILEGG